MNFTHRWRHPATSICVQGNGAGRSCQLKGQSAPGSSCNPRGSRLDWRGGRNSPSIVLPAASLLPTLHEQRPTTESANGCPRSQASIRHGARRAGWALCLAAGLAVSSAAQTRVVAVGDVHGAYPEFVAILQRAGLINADRQWIGGSSVLVQTGDVPDRGAKTRECLDLLTRISFLKTQRQRSANLQRQY